MQKLAKYQRQLEMRDHLEFISRLENRKHEGWSARIRITSECELDRLPGVTGVSETRDAASHRRTARSLPERRVDLSESHSRVPREKTRELHV